MIGYQFHHYDQGEADLPTILLLHGFMGSGHDFDVVIPLLTDRFRCLTVDLPGHGNTHVEGEDDLYRMSPTAAGLVAWLTDIGVERCHLVGYSMGGRLALYLATQYPHRFERVVLESASPGLRTVGERRNRSQRDATLAEQLEADFTTFLKHWYEQPLFASLRQHPNFPAIVRQRSQNRPPELAKSLRWLGIGQQPSLWEALATLKQPLLLVVGEHDRKFCALSQKMLQQCPAARMVTLADCGHTPHLESPQVFANWLNRFLSPAVSDVK